MQWGAIQQYQQSGRPWVGLDLGYWDRNREDYALRLSVNAKHPTELPDFGPERWDRRGVAIRDDYDPDGLVMVAGMGRKYRACNGGEDWDTRAMARAQSVFGDRAFLRQKPKSQYEQKHNTIEGALKGCAYVITHHSNVGVDAVMAGIPVATEEGAVRHLYANRLTNKPASYGERLDFLRRLAWWNWKTSETAELWPFLQDRVREAMG